MIGRLFNLHIVKSTPNNQPWKRRGFLDLLTLTSILRFHMFSSCSVKCSVKMTFWYFITCCKYLIRNFKGDFTKPSFKHAKIKFLSVAFLYSLSIVMYLFCQSYNLWNINILYIQLLSKFSPDSDLCHNYLHSLCILFLVLQYIHRCKSLFFLCFINALVEHCNNKASYLETDFISSESLACHL